MSSHGGYDGPPSYPAAGAPPYPNGGPSYPYGPPPPGPRRRSDASLALLATGVPVLALVLIGVTIAVLSRGDASTRSPGWIGTVVQASRVESSIESYWSTTLPRERGVRFRPARVEHFVDGDSSTCQRPPGQNDAFYCPRDAAIFISTTLYTALGETLDDERAAGFARSVLLAHEYGHHVQRLSGSIRDADSTGDDVARLELQADCLAGLWAHAVWESEAAPAVPLEEPPRSEDIERTFQLLGDPEPWQPDAEATEQEVHGSAEQRQAWFMSGYVEGSLAACDTFERVDPEGFPV